MKRSKKQRLERAGWVVSDAADFLGLNAEETRFVELKLALAAGVRHFRERRGLTQAALAKRLGSSQSRVAKMEAGDISVSIDLMIKSLLRIGAKASDIAAMIRHGSSSRPA
jgi:predicted XRE-type DNA-binding protein